jgi:hypothetical protein
VQRLKTLQIKSSDSGWRTHLLGWCWTPHSYNGYGYIFYGQHVRTEGFELFEEVLHNLVQMQHDLTGFFCVTGEDDAFNCTYRVINDQIHKSQEDDPLEMNHLLIDD